VGSSSTFAHGRSTAALGVTSRRRARLRRVVLSVVFFKVIFLGLASGVALGRPSSIPAHLAASSSLGLAHGPPSGICVGVDGAAQRRWPRATPRNVARRKKRRRVSSTARRRRRHGVGGVAASTASRRWRRRAASIVPLCRRAVVPSCAQARVQYR